MDPNLISFRSFIHIFTNQFIIKYSLLKSQNEISPATTFFSQHRSTIRNGFNNGRKRENLEDKNRKIYIDFKGKKRKEKRKKEKSATIIHYYKERGSRGNGGVDIVNITTRITHRCIEIA